MTKNIVIGLDIGTAFVRVVACEYKPGSNIPQVLALVKKNSRGLRRGYVVQLDEVTNSINEAISETERIIGTKIRHIILSVGGSTLESKVVEGGIIVSRADSEINTTDINRAVDASESNLDVTNKTVIQRFPLAYRLDGKKIIGRPDSMKGSKLEAQVLFITYSAPHLKNLLGAIATCGLHVDDIIAAPLAASLAVTTRLQKTAGCVLANIGSQTTSIVIFEEGLPISLRVFPIGSTDITNDIALGFQIPLEEAEKIKTGETDNSSRQKKLDQIVEARLSDIFEFIENHLKRLGRSGLLPAGIIITGGGSGINEIENRAKNFFKLPAKVSVPIVAANSRNQIRDSSWSVAYGLCLAAKDIEPEEKINIQIFKNILLNIWRWIKEILP
ncbi:MAG: cell division protein FtsA [Candidatus Paceibacterota bacterium]